MLIVVVDCFNKMNQLLAAATAQGPNIASSEGDSNIAMMEHPISSTSPGPVWLGQVGVWLGENIR